MPIRPFWLAGAAATLILAGCHRAEPAPAESDTTENTVSVEPETTSPEPPPVAPPPAEPVPGPQAPPRPKPAPEVSADQQVLDDADATGMTARSTRGDDPDAPPPTGDGNSQE